jgi:hypothetical protein
MAVKKPATKKKPAAKPAPKAKPASTLADAITVKRRDGLSWARVAEELGLKGPGAARKAYTDATGRSHNDIEGVAVVKATRAPHDPNAPKAPDQKRHRQQVADRNPHWSVDTDQDELIAKLEPTWKVGSKGIRELDEAARIKVRRTCEKAGGYTLEDEFLIRNLIGFKFDKDERNLLVEFHDDYSGGYHCLKVQDIVEVTR